MDDAGFFCDTEPHKLILCGDLLDRGTETLELIDFANGLLDEGRLIYILGNHEELLVQCIQEIARGDGVRSHHYFNKTWDSLLRIGKLDEADACGHPDELVTRVMNSSFYRRLLPAAVDYYETANYIFVHGWIPCFVDGPAPNSKYRYDPDWRNADILAWRGARWSNGMDLACKHHILEPSKTVVCGHWHASYAHALFEGRGSERGEDADFSPFYGNGIIALDACTVRSGFVNVIVINDDELADEK